MQPEKDFVQGRSDNLPKIDSFTMFSFLSNNPAFFSAEMKNVKMRRSGRESYGDQAIGYVQLKREGNLCTVLARITPEHKVRNKPYSVTLTVDENAGEILSVECKDCTASLGGCKHAVAFITWVHRRTEEPSPTSVANYWKKSKLSKVGTTVKFIRAKDLPSGKKTAPSIQSASHGNFLDCFLEEQNQTDCIVSRYFNVNDLVKHLSIHLLAGEFFQNNPDGSADGFVSFCQNNMTAESCEEAEKHTQAQSQNPLWFELRHARITASKMYEASHSKTLDGSLFEVLMGSSKFRDTAAMARGRKLEGSVVKVVEKLKNMKFQSCGLQLSREVPIFGASADGINEEYVLEIKCPSTERAMKNYISNGTVSSKHEAQIQLQMFMNKKQKGLFCVAHSDFELTSEVTIVEVEYKETFVKEMMEKSQLFWNSCIFPNLKQRFV